MKLRMLLVMLVPSLALWACEDTTEVAEEPMTEEAPAEEAAEEPAAEEAPAEEAKPGPADVCSEIVEAAKAKDEAKLQELFAQGEAQVMADEKSKQLMYDALSGVTCGEATIAEDGQSAMVAATAGEETREIPFTKVEEDWKFDVQAYMEKYPVADNTKKKAKRRKAKRRKAKRRNR